MIFYVLKVSLNPMYLGGGLILASTSLLSAAVFSRSLRSSRSVLISNVSELLQLLEESLVSTVNLGLEIERSSLAGVVSLEEFIKLLYISNHPKPRAPYLGKSGGIHLLSLKVQNLQGLSDGNSLSEAKVLDRGLRSIFTSVGLG